MLEAVEIALFNNYNYYYYYKTLLTIRDLIKKMRRGKHAVIKRAQPDEHTDQLQFALFISFSA